MEMGDIQGWIFIMLIISSSNKAGLLGRFASWVSASEEIS